MTWVSAALYNAASPVIGGWRSSSVGQSSGIIIRVSGVQIPPPLPNFARARLRTFLNVTASLRADVWRPRLPAERRGEDHAMVLVLHSDPGARRGSRPLKNSNAAEPNHSGPRPSLTTKQRLSSPAPPKEACGQGYSPPAGASSDYLLSVQARNESSAFTAFIVNEALMVILDKGGQRPPDRMAYRAHCSDGMSDRGYPYSIHLIIAPDLSWRRNRSGYSSRSVFLLDAQRRRRSVRRRTPHRRVMRDWRSCDEAAVPSVGRTLAARLLRADRAGRIEAPERGGQRARLDRLARWQKGR